MKTFTLDDLKTLTTHRAGWCVSIYMPTHRAATGTRQDQIRFKNLLREAEDRLVAGGARAVEARALVQPEPDLEANGLFWHKPDDGMAVFLSSAVRRAYHLPVGLEELVVVAHRFHVKPLLSLLHDESRFYVLALSQKAVRLLQGTRYSVSEITPENMPHNLAEALKYDEVEKVHQFHTIGSPGGGGPFAMFHGHGIGTDDSKDRILRYFQQVDHGLHRLLRDEHAPLVLAGVDYLMPIYRQANTYPQLMAEVIAGNPETQSAEALHAAAWAIVQPYFLTAQEEAFAAYRRFSCGARTARVSNKLETILPAAYQGRVESLLVAVGVQRWGVYDPDQDVLQMHTTPEPDDEDLLSLAAIHTLLTGGKVYVVEAGRMSEDVPLAAVFRF